MGRKRKMRAPERKQCGTRTVSGPYVSASQLGTMRPKMDAALRIESEYRARLLLTPYLSASAIEKSQHHELAVECERDGRCVQSWMLQEAESGKVGSV